MPDDFGGGASAAIGAEPSTDTSTALATIDSTTDVATTETQEVTETPTTDVATTDGATAQPTTLSEALAPIKASNPQLYQKAQQAVGIAGRLAKELGPKPFEALKTMRMVYDSVQQRGGLQNIEASLTDIDNLNSLYEKGDPALVEQMTSDDAGKLAMPKLLPAILTKVAQLDPYAFTAAAMQAFDRVAELDPDAWTGYMAKSMLRTLQAERIDLTVRNLASLVPADNVSGKEMATAFDAFLAKIAGYAALAPKPKPAAAAPDPRIAELEREKQETARQNRELQFGQWTTEARQPFDSLVRSEFDKLTKGRTLTNGQKESIGLLIDKHFEVARRGEFELKTGEFRDRNDKNGYLAYTRGFFQRGVPNWVRRAVTDVVGTRPGPAANGAAKPTTVAQTQAVPGNTQQNTIFKKGPVPSPDQINRFDPRTDLRGRKAVLKDGSFRSW